MLAQLKTLLRGSPDDLKGWISDPSSRNLLICALTIAAGFSTYGFTMGLWRAPLMGLYVGIKMPFLIVLTLACNGLINGMLALLIGSGLSFRQSILAQLLSFSVAALILGSLAPITLFMALNAPSSDLPGAASAHASFLVAHTLLIAFAGIMATLHLARLLLASTPNPKIAGLTLMSWLSGNAIVGAQFSYILRPFFGQPSIAVEFFREDPMNGTFFESFWFSLQKITAGQPLPAAIIGIAVLLIFLSPIFKLFSNKSKPS